MANYLKDPNHLIVWPVWKETLENDMHLGNIGIRATFDMNSKQLLDSCLDAWHLEKEKSYRLRLVRANEQWDVPIDTAKNIKEIGIRNGDMFEITAV